MNMNAFFTETRDARLHILFFECLDFLCNILFHKPRASNEVEKSL